MDTNCDGSVSSAEFVAYFSRHLPLGPTAFDDTIREFRDAAVLARAVLAKEKLQNSMQACISYTYT